MGYFRSYGFHPEQFEELEQDQRLSMMGGIIHSSSAAAYLTNAEDEGLKGSKPKFFSFDEAPIVWEILLFTNNLRLVYARYVE